MQALVRAGELPAPDYVIGGVGTQLRRFPCGSPAPGWETSARPAWDPSRVRSALRVIPNLKPQPAEFQSPHKASFFLPAASGAELDEIRQLLAAEGLEVEIVYSSERDLDVLPAGMHKGGAAEFMTQMLADSCVRTIVSGDSGNDLTLFRPAFLGVVVANAHPELRRLDERNVYHSPHSHADGVCDGVEYWLRRENSDES